MMQKKTSKKKMKNKKRINMTKKTTKKTTTKKTTTTTKKTTKTTKKAENPVKPIKATKAKTTKKTTTKKTTTKTVAKAENFKKFLIRFKSYSFDNFYMLTTNNKLVDQKTGKLKITAKEFCKTYVPEEYEGWKRRGEFEYELFEVWPVGDDGIAKVVNRIGGPFIFTETDRINTNEMPEDVAFFSDSIDFV